MVLFSQVADIDLHEFQTMLLDAAEEVRGEDWFLAAFGNELHVLHEPVPDFFFDIGLVFLMNLCSN